MPGGDRSRARLARAREGHVQVSDRLLADRRDELGALEQPAPLLRRRAIAHVGVRKHVLQRPPTPILAHHVLRQELLPPRPHEEKRPDPQPDGRTVLPSDVVGPARRGRTVVLTGDTAPARSVVEAAAGADVLVHEATFLADERARARETGHSTAGEAALVAREADVGLLALMHLSARYPPAEVADEARQLFPRTVVPRDFDLLEVPLPERGEPELVPRGGRRGRATEDVGSGA